MRITARIVCLLSSSLTLLSGEATWKDKAISEWSEADAKQVLTDSPWAKSVIPIMNRPDQVQRGGGRQGGGQGRGGGLGLPGGIGIGLPGGLGGGRGRGGIGGQGGPGGNRGGYPPQDTTVDGSGEKSGPPELIVRWESAAPVQAAELKAKESGAPDIDVNSYAIVVAGFPNRTKRSGLDLSEATLKKSATIKRDGKKALKPTSVKILSKDGGMTVVYSFSRKDEISLKESEVNFAAKVGAMELHQVFVPTEMVFQGKLEL